MDFLILFISGIFTLITIIFIRNMLLNNKKLAKNYKGDSIPLGMGISFIFVMLLNSIFFLIFLNIDLILLFLMLVGILSMAFIGAIDDFIGDRNSLGFKGHIASFFKATITTGFLKMLMGGLIGLFISLVISTTTLELVINILLIGLFTNLINLFDLRPGRAIKVCILIIILMLILGVKQELRPILLSILGFNIFYLPQDLMALSMMGDVGSNALGISLGIITIIGLETYTKFVILGVIILIHLYAEKYSLSKTIEGNILLRFMDNLGRRS